MEKENNFFDKMKSVMPSWMGFGGNLELSEGNQDETREVPTAEFMGGGGGTYRYLFSVSYNGEKNLGEIGPIKDYRPDYDLLRLRSWQAYLESDVAMTIINKKIRWEIGKGLKLQAEPVQKVLELEGIKFDSEEFCDAVENYFNIFRKSKTSDYAGMNNLNRIARTARKNAIIGGDVLTILRYDGDNITIQLIDGCHVQSPEFGTELYPQQLANGNEIKNGIETDVRGKHIRYYVRGTYKNPLDFKFYTIEAIGKNNNLQVAFLVYGMEYRLNNVRGLPLVSAILEKMKKLERYAEATLGSAEERAKLVYFFEHGLGSTGENPLQKTLAKAFDFNAADTDLPKDINGTELANLVSASTNKQTFNLPIDTKVSMPESRTELHFADFFKTNFNMMCATLDIPPDVAMSLYNSNFSASRAALKDWEHSLDVERADFSFQFYQKIYEFWLDIMILKNKIPAQGYLLARGKKDKTVLECYRMARFVGSPVPHIDPLKEVNAVRALLGPNGAQMPLTTLEEAIESLNKGESRGVVEQFAKEYKSAVSAGVVVPVVPSVGVSERS